MKNQLETMLLELGERPICFQPAYVRISGSINAGLMLSQMIYWTRRIPESSEGWFYKTREEWYDELHMTRYEQEGARKLLREAGILIEELRGVPARVHFRLDTGRIIELLLAYQQPTSWGKTSQLGGGKPANITSSEITTEITSESEPEKPENLENQKQPGVECRDCGEVGPHRCPGPSASRAKALSKRQRRDERAIRKAEKQQEAMESAKPRFVDRPRQDRPAWPARASPPPPVDDKLDDDYPRLKVEP